MKRVNITCKFLNVEVHIHHDFRYFLPVGTWRDEKLFISCKNRKHCDEIAVSPTSSTCTAARTNCTLNYRESLQKHIVTRGCNHYPTLTLRIAGLSICNGECVIVKSWNIVRGEQPIYWKLTVEYLLERNNIHFRSSSQQHQINQLQPKTFVWTIQWVRSGILDSSSNNLYNCTESSSTSSASTSIEWSL